METGSLSVGKSMMCFERIMCANCGKKIIKITLSIEIVLLAVMFFITIFKWKGEYLVPSRIDFWLSRGIEYDKDGWYADEGLVDEGFLLPGEEIEILYGPYISLEKGDYLVSIEYEANQDQSFIICAFEQNDKIKCYDTLLPYNSLSSTPTDNTSVVTCRFSLSDFVENAEVRIGYNGYGFIRIKNISIVKSAYIYRTIFKYMCSLFLSIDLVIAFVLMIIKREQFRIAFSYVLPAIINFLLIIYNTIFILTKGRYFLDQTMSESFIALMNKIRLSFPFSLTLIRGIGTGILLVIYVSLFVLILVNLKIDIRLAMLLSSLLIMPFSVANIKMVTFGAHRILGIIIILALILIMQKVIGYKENIPRFSQLLILTLIEGCYLVIASIDLFKNNESANFYQLTPGVTGGYVFENISAFLAVFGWHQGNIMSYNGCYDGRIYLLGQNIINLFSFFITAMIILSFTGLVINRNTLEKEEKILAAVLPAMLLVNVLYSFVVGTKRLGYGYWIYIIPFSILTIAIYMKEFTCKIFPRSIILILLCFAIMSFASVKDFKSEPADKYPELVHVTDFLLYNGYTNGSTGEKYSYVIEELSDRKIKFEPFDANSDNLNDKVFILEKDAGNEDTVDELLINNARVVYNNPNGFCVYEVSNNR